jgi:integrase
MSSSTGSSTCGRRVRDNEVGAPKSGRGRREVPLSPGLARELAAHRLSAQWSRDDDLVFAGETGEPLEARNLYRWLRPAVARAGVEWAAFHTLRHTAASRWLLSGVTIAQVSRLLGATACTGPEVTASPGPTSAGLSSPGR